MGKIKYRVKLREFPLFLINLKSDIEDALFSGVNTTVFNLEDDDILTAFDVAEKPSFDIEFVSLQLKRNGEFVLELTVSHEDIARDEEDELIIRRRKLTITGSIADKVIEVEEE